MSTALRGVGFHGRRRELALLEEQLERAAAGRLGVMLVQGEAGIGKTRLAAEAAGLAARRGAASFFGRSEELGVRPFGAWADAFACTRSSADPARAGIARLLAEGTAGHDPGLQHRIVGAFVDLLEQDALDDGALLILDDLQWADTPTLLTVRAVAQRLAFVPLLVVGLFRPVPRRHALERLVDALTREGARHLAVGPLAERDVAALARDAVGADPGPRLSALLARTAGNPLFASETLLVLEAEGEIELAGGRAEVPEVSLPPSLAVTVLRRIGYLPQGTTEVLRLAAVLGPSFAPAELAAATGRSVVELMHPLEEARRAGILDGEDAALRFRHDVIREALYSDLPGGVRAALHAEVARRLAASGAPALRVAEQFRLGSAVGDVEAVAWLRRAADETVSSDPAVAIELLHRAVALAPAGEGRDDLRAQLASFHAYGASPGQAEEIARDLLASRPGASVERRAHAALIQALLAQGRWAEVVAHAAAACDGDAVDDRARGRMLAESALARMWVGDLQGAAHDAREAVRLGEAVGDPVAVCLGLGHLSGVAQHLGDFDEAVALGRRGVDVARSGGRDAERRHPHMAFGMALVIAGRLRDAAAAFSEGRRVGERLGTVWHLPIYHSMLGLALHYLGEWDEAVATAETSLALADDTGVRLGSLTALSVLADIAVHRGQLPIAARSIAAADRIVEQSGPQWGATWLSLARARLLASQGDRQGAQDVLEEQWRLAEAQRSLADVLLVGPPLVRVAAEPDLRRAVAAAVQDAAAHTEVAYGRAAGLLCRGLADDDAAALLAAVDVYRASDRAPDFAAAGEDAATSLAQAGRVDESRPLFEEALTAFEGLGAGLDVARVAARMRAAGIRRGVRGRRARATSGWEALTPAELKVAQLAAERLTNREIAERLFVSRDTVKTHLGHIFGKLDIASRRALAAELRRHGG